jgi:hypothetical protein
MLRTASVETLISFEESEDGEGACPDFHEYYGPGISTESKLELIRHVLQYYHNPLFNGILKTRSVSITFSSERLSVSYTSQSNGCWKVVARPENQTSIPDEFRLERIDGKISL